MALFFFTYVIAEILSDNLGKHILEDPKPYVTLQKEKFCNAIRKLWELMTPDITKIDEYTQENGNSLITKTCSALQFVKSTGKIKKDYTKATRKDLTNEFEKIFESA
ncbi:MAG: hypothetical protein U0X92_10775 [Anaerolineales bacterium]